MIQSPSISDKLIVHGLKPSYQRKRIYEYLENNRQHPTVDTVFKDLSKSLPTLSKTTVYNTVKLFAEKGILSIIVIEGNELRIDPFNHSHGHFKCIKCGMLSDVEIDLSKLSVGISTKFKVNEYHAYFKGYCERCAD